ncbi:MULTISPECIES: putative DNA modification/repair radical SAM protein [Aminobacterium]|uniref:putative DNA modification/repair radical SAM protein n=1 Tax=Aminobacterium TaxID=81466 RepID=UPI0025804278|nr:putative DNA modification/repair radical SAM protein [Aminobacterium sp. UBA4834]
MDTEGKLIILADAAKYDVSCSSSGSQRKNPSGIGNASLGGICHSWTADGRCVSLLKVLFSNDCIYDCAYCVNRRSVDRPRATFTPEELAGLTINFYRRNYIEGLFLSSGVYKSPNHTMEYLLQTLLLLRQKYRFGGYIHTKVIPGSDPALVDAVGQYTDRMSVNIELPTEKSLTLLAPQKSKESILRPMKHLTKRIEENQLEKPTWRGRKAPLFVPAGQSTQLIVGATPEDDLTVLRLSENLYSHYNLKRVYYSAYVPVSDNPLLPALSTPPLRRENRLYQADWLLRFYRFKASELLDEKRPYFDLDLDPKTDWALRNLQFFPVEINKASYEQLLRVPGIGVKSAKKIVVARKNNIISFELLSRLGVVIKRAQYFITCNGVFRGDKTMDETRLRHHFLAERSKFTSYGQQLFLFES